MKESIHVNAQQDSQRANPTRPPSLPLKVAIVLLLDRFLAVTI